MKKYIKSLRLRTLPLSAAGIILGNCLAISYSDLNISIFILSLLTALMLQILSNLANELGDYYHGLDGNQHEGPQYSLQNGDITIKELKSMIIGFAVSAVIFGILLLYVSMGTLLSVPSIIFLIAGGLAIAAALKYTLGNKPYGYRALGDLFVFIFFGIVCVMGCNYLQTKHFIPQSLLPATAIGFLSVAVLNLNNIRDLQNDAACGKITLAGKLGEQNAKIYHASLILAAIMLLTLYGCPEALLLAPVFIYHTLSVFKLKGKKLDVQFPILSFSTLALSLLCSILMIFGLS